MMTDFRAVIRVMVNSNSTNFAETGFIKRGGRRAGCNSNFLIVAERRVLINILTTPLQETLELTFCIVII